MTGDSVEQPTWLLNNKTRPDGSLGYGYQGSPATYPPAEPAFGFYRSVAVGEDEPGAFMLSPLGFPADRLEKQPFMLLPGGPGRQDSAHKREGFFGTVTLHVDSRRWRVVPRSL